MQIYRKLSREPSNQIIRVALFDVLDDEPFGNEKSKKFPCRVVYRFLDPDLGDRWPWYISCRGKDGNSEKFFWSGADAIAWLKEEKR